MDEFKGLGAAVCGVSTDGSERLERFTTKYRLPFTLLSDRDGSVAARYGSLLNLLFVKLARRNTFLIDPRGIVAKAYLGVSASRNAGEVAADLKELAA
jgi:peroxiredoxin Q/BCP